MLSRRFKVILFGGVDFGKTTIAKVLTGKWLMASSEEHKRGITIDLNVTDFSVYHTPEGYSLDGPGGDRTDFQLIDNPGHRTLFTTSISGLQFADILVLVMTTYQQPSEEYLRAVLKTTEILGVPVVFLQNKIELVGDLTQNEATVTRFIELCLQIRPDSGPIKVIPFSALEGVNTGALLRALWEASREAPRGQERPFFEALKSFDVNRPHRLGTTETLTGAIVGGVNHGSPLSTNTVAYLSTIRGERRTTQIRRVLVDNVPSQEAHGEGFYTLELSAEPSLATRKGLVGAYLSVTPLEFSSRATLKVRYRYLTEVPESRVCLLVFGARILLCRVLESAEGWITVASKNDQEVFPVGVPMRYFVFYIVDHLWALGDYCEHL